MQFQNYLLEILKLTKKEIKISDEVIGVPSVSLMQKDTNTSTIRLVGRVWPHQGEYMNIILLIKKKIS